MFVVSRDKGLCGTFLFSLEEQGGFGKTHCGLSIVTRCEQAERGWRTRSDSIFTIQLKPPKVRSRAPFQLQSAFEFPPGIVFHGTQNLHVKINLRGQHPCIYNLSMNANRCFFVSKTHHPPRLLTPSTFQVPSRTSAGRSNEVLCCVHLDS